MKYYNRFYKDLLFDFCEENLIFFRVYGYIVIFLVNLFYIVLFFLGKEKFILRKCYSNIVLGYLKYRSRWFFDSCVIGINLIYFFIFYLFCFIII